MFDQETPDPGRRESLLTDSSSSFRRPDGQGFAVPADVVPEDAPAGETVHGVAVPKTVGPFTIVETLGTGAMGEVYLARDQRLERWVALKRIHPSRYGRESVLRFRREARAAAKLHHRSIVQVHDLLETEESDWLVMERLEGESLADRLREGPLEPLEALHIAIRIGEGLTAAHDAGVMHRDLKASNIMLTPNGVRCCTPALSSQPTTPMRATPKPSRTTKLAMATLHAPTGKPAGRNQPPSSTDQSVPAM